MCWGFERKFAWGHELENMGTYIDHHRDHKEMKRDPFTAKIIGCAIEVHRALGPGLLESTYQQCLAHEFHLKI
jgi:hypothetical protein